MRARWVVPVVLAAWAGLDAADLSVPSAEYRSIGAALSKARAGDTVWVEDGVYREHVMLNPGVVLKARRLHGAVVDGRGRGTVVTLANGATIAGLTIRNGTAGVVSKSAGTRILMCRVVNNDQSGITCVGHLPELTDNVIAYNQGSGIQGWDLRSTSASVNHNTIAFNGNHGVALGGVSDVIVENCIIAFNGQFGVRAEAGSVQARVVNTDLFRNGTDVTPLSNGNVSVDPVFGDARRNDFSLQPGSRCIGAGSDSQDLGSRQVAAQ